MISPEHPATVTLLLQRLAVDDDGDAAAKLEPILGAIDWERLVATASGHLVLPALYPALVRFGSIASPRAVSLIPADALEFLASIHAANGARNRMLRTALVRYAAALNAVGIEPVPLKGACTLLEADGAAATEPAAWRFLSDLDILVPEREAALAHDIAIRLGYVPSSGDYQPARDAHYPALVSPCDRYAIELHTRVFAEPIMPALETRIVTEAQVVTIDGARFRLPTPAHRIAHLIGHAQFHHRHWAAGRVHLRNLLDLSMLARTTASAPNWGAVLALFAEGEERRGALAFIALWRAAMAARADGVFLHAGDRTWAARTMARLQYPALVRTAAIMAGLGMAQLRHSLAEKATLRRNFNVLMSPRECSLRLKKLVRRARQMHWA